MTFTQQLCVENENVNPYLPPPSTIRCMKVHPLDVIIWLACRALMMMTVILTIVI